MANSAILWFEAYLIVYPEDRVSYNEAQKIDIVTILQYRLKNISIWNGFVLEQRISAFDIVCTND